MSDTPAFAAPVPLPDGGAAVPPFDPDLLPAPVRDFVADIAARTGSPTCVPAVAVVVALGAVIGRNAGIHPRAGDAALAVPNLWAALLADGAIFRDGPALEAAIEPLETLEARAHTALLRDVEHYAAHRAAFDVALRVWKARVRREARAGHDASVLAATHPREPVPPARRRYRTASTAMKTLVTLLNANPGGLLITPDDLAVWLRRRAAPDRDGEREFLLRCWSGAAPGFDVDPAVGPALHCAHPCLSVLGWMTTEARDRLLAPGIEAAGARELLSRFTLTVCPQGPRVPEAPDRPPDGPARDRAFGLFERLDQAVRRAAAGSGPIPAFRFDPEAQDFVHDWLAERARRTGALENGGLALLLARQGEAMPALALVLHLAEGVEAGGGAEAAPAETVPMHAARRAVAWCEYLEAHARRLHGADTSPALAGARTLLERLRAGDLPAPFTVRDVYRRHWSGLRSPGPAQAAVRLLEQHGYLAAEPVPTTVRGGKPTRLYHRNPAA